MADDQSLFIIDSHTMGEPTRIIVNGFPEVDGNTIMEKKICLQKNYDHLRRAIINEPRGHRNMFGALLMKPIHKEADLAVIFMDGGGYLNMCGHGSIGVATIAVIRGLVPVTEPYTHVALETPAGLIRTRVKVENGRVKEACMINVPAFLYRKDVAIQVPKWGEIRVDVAFGGNFFALVNAENLGIALIPENLNRLLQIGVDIRESVNQQTVIQHPLLSDIHSVDLVEFFEPLHDPRTIRNTVVFGKRQVDRSPCGTGTSAKIASLCARGELKLGEDFVCESIMGTRFTGHALGKTAVGDYPAVIPEITGRAYVTGESRLIFDDEDPFEFGFAL
ncbi:proline racemase family protein [Sporolactobacillus terrae]|uniref:Proline racemase n=1 Tax=Sporolactobacillus terrae TaxID=269673 RepID=A0ABX5Q4A8_9BACL|nr:proline racemase family protein [Sporolactobacillus terrae]QAA21469.1 proline racemase [Sporolactobacillus terrae]QAA24441.1 proline racemase [Sporolactobacillus terrae]UAK16268.1 proline racemase family protein [Sporolactobacillus terrae]